LVVDYGLQIELFPRLHAIVDKTTSMYFISRVFKDPHSPDYMPLQKVEDMLRG